MTHQKPTQEELDAGIKKSLEDLEKEDPEEKEDENEEPKKDEEAEDGKKADDEEDPDEEENEPKDPQDPKVKEQQAEEEKEPEKKAEIDYKQKNIESQREALVLHAKNKKLNEVIAAAGELPAPTDEEMIAVMKADGEDWADLSNMEKRLARDNEHNKRKFAAIDSASKEGKNIDEWNSQVDTFVGDPKTLVDNPELEGKVEDFKLFAMKPTRRGLDFEDLVLAFNGDRAKSAPPKQKGAMFERGNGGSEGEKTKKKGDDKLSVEESGSLMQTDFNKYKSLLKAGKIATE